MILNEDLNSGDYRITSYTPGQVIINGSTYHKSVIVSEHQLILDWPPQTLADLKTDHLKTVFGLSPNVVLLGTGSHFLMPSTELLTAFHQHKIGVESMDTRAACRTFMALMSEGRNVVVVLFL